MAHGGGLQQSHISQTHEDSAYSFEAVTDCCTFACVCYYYYFYFLMLHLSLIKDTPGTGGSGHESRGIEDIGQGHI